MRPPTMRTLAAATLWAALLFHPAAAPAQQSLQQRVEGLVQPYLDNDVVVGLSIGVLHDGQESYFGYGAMSKDDSRTPDEQTVYEIGSISKVFTGLLLADAVVQGRLTLDQPAAELLPEGVTMPRSGQRPITLVQLSTHTSGLPPLPDNFQPADPEKPYADYTVDQMYAFLNGHTLRRPPGEKTEYSNFAVGLLGHLLSLEADKPYEELLAERIAGPLGMQSTSITFSEDQRARLAPPHRADLAPTVNWDIPTLAGAGAIRSTVADMLRFARAMIAPPEGAIGEAVELAWKIHQEPLEEGQFALALGWHIARDGQTRWHNGQTGGYHAMLLVNRQLEASVVLLSNTGTTEVDRLAEDVLRMVLGADVAPRQFAQAVEVSLEVMSKFVGKYELAPGAVFTVSVEDGKLMIGLTGQPTFEVFARSEQEWVYKVVPATVTFNLNAAGECTSLTLLQNGAEHEAQRIDEAGEP